MIDESYLKQHFSQLSDDELRRTWGSDLVPQARQLLAHELKGRGISCDDASVRSDTPALAATPISHRPAQKAAPAWSRFIQFYALFAPWILLRPFGIRIGVIWLFLLSGIGFVMALRVAIRVRTGQAATLYPGRVIFGFVACHTAALFAIALGIFIASQ